MPSMQDNVSRRKSASPLGRALFTGLRALDVWWQYRLLTSGWASAAIAKLHGHPVPTAQILSSAGAGAGAGLQPYYGLITLLALGSSAKQIATMLLVSEQETPIASALTIAFFNTVFNSLNTLLSAWSVTSQSPATGLLSSPAIALGAAAYTVGILTEAISEVQRTAFKKDARNKGAPYAGGLFSLATNVNYGGYTLWRGGYALVCGGVPWGAVTFSFFFWDFAVRGVPVLEQYLVGRV
ncbi:uncharacterized protein DSM5745_05787 [Aspergillus mulundensis]|uniref:3-oxo-5-alpha-steroid 4-dehydrogenase C-terminal domain-containing protein n=1 Tax=Aspergillus mulundensis TaxID=1810919 RepID=A0A3D8RY29_9EURO|nr:Uncharacterized protein DSM5745_05787 [Aspergillus mulundensis]RDW78935.1 Uncharacterized protein DSM5745_05787 [Aspergillus mulundensis]